MIDTYTALDLETTGLSTKHDRIIEIGAVKVEKGREAASFQTMVNPGRRLEEQVVALTGISDAMLEDAPEAEEVIPRLLEFIGEDVILGHRIIFDFAFIKKAAVNQKLIFEKEGIDTLGLSRKFLPELESRRLASLCSYFGIPHEAHRALGDAAAASALYLRLAELFYKDHEGDFKPRPLHWQVKKETPVTKSQKERLYKLLDKHRITVGYEIEKLTRNEADRIMDRILAERGR